MLRALLIALSQSKSLRWLKRPLLASGYHGALSLDFLLMTLCASRAMNQLGLSVSVDNLGENVTNVEEARRSAQLYHQLLEEMYQQQLNANVSLKLTHVGLDVDESLAYELTSGLAAHAVKVNNFLQESCFASRDRENRSTMAPVHQSG